MKLKDPLQSFSVHKKSSSTITSLFKRNKEIDADPMKKFIRELYSDLEMVYVGHLCLSWEFLHWEYEKALKIWENDQYGFRRFNEVAGEFQQFQVLLQRFIENEPFQCPRVENYARNRCAMKNLLQVPVIRGENFKSNVNLSRSTIHTFTQSRVLVVLGSRSDDLFFFFEVTYKFKMYDLDPLTIDVFDCVNAWITYCNDSKYKSSENFLRFGSIFFELCRGPYRVLYIC